jgi:hypothetical protein
MRSAAAALAAAVALAGCGGSSLSDRDLRSDADAICTAANTRTTRLEAPRSPSTATAYLQRGAAQLQHELTALQALGAPSDLASSYRGAVGEFAAALADVRATVARIGRGAGPIGAIRALELQLAPVLTRENASWRALQIPACMQS